MDNVIPIHAARTVSTPAADSRPGLRQLLATLAAALARVTSTIDLQAIFEEHSPRLLSMRSVRLRELPTRYHARLVTPTQTPDSIVVGEPTTDPRVQVVLEASFEHGRRLADDDFEMLTSVAHLGSLVLEASRSRAVTRPAPDGAAPLIGSTAVMQALRQRLERVALTDFTVLIDGESGTGKELVARQLHELGRRSHGPFVAVNCAAVVETLLEAELFGIEDRTATGVKGRRGKFEHADNGTLFLDEVGDLSLTAQAKLLRALQDLTVQRVGGAGLHRVNTRIVAATNRPLAQMVEQGLFRADLFYRLSGVEVHVPPLRTRSEDIEELATYFLSRHRQTRELALSRAALEALCLYAWPGNVRELERLIERAVALTESDRIELDDLPAQVRGRFGEVLGVALSSEDSMREWGSRYARLVFEQSGRNKRRTCRLLDISYHTLQAYLQYADRDRDRTPPSRQTPAWARTSRRDGCVPDTSNEEA